MLCKDVRKNLENVMNAMQRKNKNSVPGFPGS